MLIRIIPEKCTGCKLCLRPCPYAGVEMVGEVAVLNERCTFCGACVPFCKSGAIEVVQRQLTSVDTGKYRGVWVIAEHDNGVLRSSTIELLGEGRKLADKLQAPLEGVVLGDGVQPLAEDMIRYGADKVYVADHPVLSRYRTGPYADVTCGLVNKKLPEIILVSASTQGRDLAPRLAARIGAGLTADCTALEIDPDQRLLVQTRPAFGGNLMATIHCPNARPQMATVRPNVMKKAALDPGRVGDIENVPVNLDDRAVATKILEVIRQEEGKEVNLADAQIIVSGGRGLGKAENFQLIRNLAEVLGAAVGASRATVDAGWIPAYHQVGQTGKTVQPKLYIACGISGAVQHLAGMSSSDTIVAINKDANAPIFDVATYGIVGDLFEIVPALTSKLKELLS